MAENCAAGASVPSAAGGVCANTDNSQMAAAASPSNQVRSKVRLRLKA